MVDPGHYIEDEKETWCWFHKQSTKAYVVQHNDDYTVVCKRCKARGPKAKSVYMAWRLWEGAGDK